MRPFTDVWADCQCQPGCRPAPAQHGRGEGGGRARKTAVQNGPDRPAEAVQKETNARLPKTGAGRRRHIERRQSLRSLGRHLPQQLGFERFRPKPPKAKPLVGHRLGARKRAVLPHLIWQADCWTARPGVA